MTQILKHSLMTRQDVDVGLFHLVLEVLEENSFIIKLD